MDSRQTDYGIAVIGVGIAGGVRIRDTKALTSDGDITWSLKGFVSRRTLDIPDTDQLNMEDVLSRSDIDVLIICTENNTHESIIRQGLENNKHVLVEYPLALSSSVAKELYQIAENKGLILHQENIALLNSFKDELAAAGRWIKADINLMTGFHSKVCDPIATEKPFIANVSLIETVYHLCGNVKVIGGEYVSSDSGFQAVAKLQTEDDREVSVTLSRYKDNQTRKKSVKFMLEDGNELSYVLSRPKSDNSGKLPVGLFMQDFLIFIRKVHNKKNCEIDKRRTLRSIEIAEEIHQFFKK